MVYGLEFMPNFLLSQEALYAGESTLLQDYKGLSCLVGKPFTRVLLPFYRAMFPFLI